MTNSYTLFATAPKGLEALLADELRQLGAGAIRISRAGVSFSGDLKCAYRVCLWSRMASRVLLTLAHFPGETPEDLYQGASAMEWDQHLRPDDTLLVDCTLTLSPLRHSQYAAQKVKDAIVDQFQIRYGRRPSVAREQPSLRVNLHVQRQEATLSVDLAGTALHRRGYRMGGMTAPLKENVAAAMLLRAGWPDIARAGRPLIDPMCGSGTLLIEGILMAADGAPGLLRKHHGFLTWLRHEPEIWRELLEEAKDRYANGLKHLPPAIGYDADKNAVVVSLTNIAAAGLANYIAVEQRSLAELLPSPRKEPALILTNPPYGERLGEIARLKGLYAELGTLIKTQSPGSRTAILTANRELGDAIGIAPLKHYTLYNGGLECRLLCFDAEPTARTGRATPTPRLRTPGAMMFANRLRKNMKTLGRWARKEGIHCYRLYDADLPEYNLAVDLYHGERLWVHAQEYAPPASIDSKQAEWRLRDALQILPEVLEIPSEQLHFRVRQRQRGNAQYQRLSEQARFHTVSEGGCQFWVNFTDYLDTGLFLDHRPVRSLIGQLARGRHFLNLFSYTGSATVHAAGHATTTTTVDLSGTYLEWAKRNMALNGYLGKQHCYIQTDCITWLTEQAQQQKSIYSLIFLDPPTFSNSKRTPCILDVQRDHTDLIRNAMLLLEHQGILIFSTNYRRFKLDTVVLNDLAIEDISQAMLPRDFARNPNIHRVWMIRHSP